MWPYFSDDNCRSQIPIDVIPGIFNGNHAALLQVRHYCDRLPAVAAERKEKSVEFFVISLNSFDDVLLTFLYIIKIHIILLKALA